MISCPIQSKKVLTTNWFDAAQNSSTFLEHKHTKVNLDQNIVRRELVLCFNI
jgi:hypothetical protein